MKNVESEDEGKVEGHKKGTTTKESSDDDDESDSEMDTD